MDSHTPPSQSSSLYTPLASGAQSQIRLIKLHPGQWPDCIVCSLHTEYLARNPLYKALSYAWGPPKSVRPISLNNREWHVTSNLFSALCRLRSKDCFVTLWVDALCINQSDNEERASQVERMREIYANAEEVVIYLGEVEDYNPNKQATSDTKDIVISHTDTQVFLCNNHDASFLDVFQTRCTSSKLAKHWKLESAIDAFCLVRSLAESADPMSCAPFNDSSRTGWHRAYQRHLFETLRQMLRCRWFDRVWTVQEIVVPKAVTVAYGPSIAPWDMFVKAAKHFATFGDTARLSSFPLEHLSVMALFSRRILDIADMRDYWSSGVRAELLPLLRQFSGRGATDDRDKVYALLGLSRDPQAVTPNYSLDVPAVFTDTALRIIDGERSLAILAGDIGRKNRQDLRSWVPDWSATYDDVDRRRATWNTHYTSMQDSSVCVMDCEWDASYCITKLVGERSDESESWNVHITNTLGDSKWTAYLRTPQDSAQPIPPEDCFEALQEHLTIKAREMAMYHLGAGIVMLPGYHVDVVDITGEVMFSFEDIYSVIRSWVNISHGKVKKDGISELSQDFLRTICADMVCVKTQAGLKHRRIQSTDLKPISDWILHKVFGNQRGVISDSPELKVDPSAPSVGDLDIETTLRMATNRRRFFSTPEGLFGLGPASMSVHDLIYLLPGSRTPFILRRASFPEKLNLGSFPFPTREFGRTAFLEVMGDCYVQGWMDGRASDSWKRDWALEPGRKHHGLTSVSEFHRTRWLANYLALRSWDDMLAALMKIWKTERPGINDENIMTLAEFRRNVEYSLGIAKSEAARSKGGVEEFSKEILEIRTNMKREDPYLEDLRQELGFSDGAKYLYLV